MFQSFFEQVYTVYKTSNSSNGIVSTRDLAFRSGPSTLGLVIFCILFGSVLNTIGAKGKVIKEFFEGVFEVLMKLTTIVMWLSGVGMCSIVTGKLLAIGNLPEILSQLAVFVLCVSLRLASHQLVMLPLIYFICLRKNPFKFYSKLADPWITAFGVSSSAVALPVATQCMVNKVKSDEKISKFVLSIGKSSYNCTISTVKIWTLSVYSYSCVVSFEILFKFLFQILGVTLNNNGTAFFLAVSTILIDCNDSNRCNRLFDVNAISSRRSFTYIAGSVNCCWCWPAKCISSLCHRLDIVSNKLLLKNYFSWHFSN